MAFLFKKKNVPLLWPEQFAHPHIVPLEVTTISQVIKDKKKEITEQKINMNTSTSSINEQKMIINFNPSYPKNNVLRNTIGINQVKFHHQNKIAIQSFLIQL